MELNKLAQILRKQRVAAGAIDFDRVDATCDKCSFVLTSHKIASS